MKPMKTQATGQTHSLCLDWMPKASQAILKKIVSQTKPQRARGAFHDLQLVPLCVAWGEARTHWKLAQSGAGTMALRQMQQALKLVDRFARGLGMSADARHWLVMQLYR